MNKDIKELLKEVAAIPDCDIIEPDLDVGPTHNVIGKITDMNLRRLFTAYAKKVYELEGLHQAVKGLMAVAGIIPPAIYSQMLDLQTEMDMLREEFFTRVSRLYNLFDRRYVSVHKDWLVSWSDDLPTPTAPSPGSVDEDADPD